MEGDFRLENDEILKLKKAMKNVLKKLPDPHINI